MPVSSCPDDPTLTQLLAGLLSVEQAELYEPHLAHCQRCAVRAAELAAGDDLAAALRDTGTADETASLSDGSIVAGLIERLSGLANHPNLAHMPTEDEVRSVLRPAEAEGELGRIGHYRVQEVLGAGAMGIVFKAEDEELGRPVAVKVMRPHLATNRDAGLRFRREACAAAAFEHNHVVTIYHVGEDLGTPFFSMQLLEGESLRSRMVRPGRLPVREVLRIGREIAMGLDAAHRRGLLHRDIKPDNVWLDAEGDQVRILDFGLARAADQASSITHAGAIMGTPNYMAPEQIRGEKVDERCDLFSLGSLLYHVATGQTPFAGNNVVATLISVSQDSVTPPQTLNPELPAALCNLIVQLLEKNPDDRVQTAGEIVRRITDIEQQLEQPTKAAKPPRHSRRTLWLIAAASGLALAAAAIVYVVTNKGTLIVEADDAVAVSVEQGLVTIRDRATGREWTAKIGENPVRAGTYEIYAKEKGSDIEVSAPELSILRGEERRVHLSLKSEPVAGAAAAAPKPDGATQSPASLPVPTWLSETDDSLGIQPGDPLSPLALVSQPARLDNVTSWTVEPAEHRSTVGDITFSPDGTQIATAGQDGTVHVWDTKTRELLKIIVCPGPVGALAWSNDGRYLATAQESGAGSICIWELNDQSTRLAKKINRGTDTLAWSSDGRFLAFEDNGVQFWDFASGDILPNFGVMGAISRHPWSAEGCTLATTREEGIAWWDVARQQPVGVIFSDGVPRSHAIWSRHGAYIACVRGGPGTATAQPKEAEKQDTRYVEIWDTAKKQRIRNFTIGTGRGDVQLSWSPDESRIVTRFENATATWDVKTGTRKAELPRQDDLSSQYPWLTSLVDWSPDPSTIGLLICGKVELWNAAQSTLEAVAGRRDFVTFPDGAFLADKGLLATTISGDSPSSTIWDLRQLKPVTRVDGKDIPQLLLSPDGKRAATVPESKSRGRQQSSNFQVRILDFSSPEDVSVTLQMRGDSPHIAAVWSPDGSRLLVQDVKSNQLFVLEGTHVAFEARGSKYIPGGFPRPVWSPDSEFLAYYADKGISIVGLRSRETALLLDDDRKGNFQTATYALDWSPDGKWVAEYLPTGPTVPTAHISIWNVSAQKEEPNNESEDEQKLLPAFTLACPISYSSAVLFSPDNQSIASASGSDIVTVWELASGNKTAEVRCPCKSIFQADWLADSRHIFFRSQELYGVVDAKSGQVLSRTEQFRLFRDTLASGNTLVVGGEARVSFNSPRLDLCATLLLPDRVDVGALFVQSNGSFRLGPDASQPRIVALVDGTQRTFTPDEFSQQFGWQNQPVNLDFLVPKTTGTE